MAGARVECAAGVNDAAAVPLHREHVRRAAAHRSARTCRRRPWNARRRRRRDHLAVAHHQQAVGDELVQRYRAHCPFRRPQAVRHRQGAGRRGGGYRHAAVARSLLPRHGDRLTLAFARIVLVQLFNALDARADDGPLLGRFPLRDRTLWLCLAGLLAVHLPWAPKASVRSSSSRTGGRCPRRPCSPCSWWGSSRAECSPPRAETRGRPRRAGSSAREGGVRGEARQMGRGGPMAGPTSLGGALRAAARPAPSPPRPPSPAGRPACAAPRIRRPR